MEKLEQLETPAMAEGFGVDEGGWIGVARQNDRSGHNRPGERASTDFIATGDLDETLAGKRLLVVKISCARYGCCEKTLCGSHLLLSPKHGHPVPCRCRKPGDTSIQVRKKSDCYLLMPFSRIRAALPRRERR